MTRFRSRFTIFPTPCCCFLAAQTLISGAQARTLALIFSFTERRSPAFALIQGISSNGKLYWIRQPRMGGWIYGPYVNHNHYAGLMEMLVPIPLVLALTRSGHQPAHAARLRHRCSDGRNYFSFRVRAAACWPLSPNCHSRDLCW